MDYQQYGMGAAALAAPGIGAPIASMGLSAAGIRKRGAAEDEALQQQQNATWNYMGQSNLANQQMGQAGAAFQKGYGQAQLGAAQDRTVSAQMAPAAVQSDYARAMAGAQGAMQGGQADIPQMAQLRSAAAKAYAGNAANTAGARAMQAQMPGAYTQALNQQAMREGQIGQNQNLQMADIGQNAQQMQGLNQLQVAQNQADYANKMGQAQTAMMKAKQVGSEQMLYGQLIHSGVDMAVSGAGAANQYGLQQQQMSQNQAMQQQMQDYYKQQGNQRNDARYTNDFSRNAEWGAA